MQILGFGGVGGLGVGGGDTIGGGGGVWGSGDRAHISPWKWSNQVFQKQPARGPLSLQNQDWGSRWSQWTPLGAMIPNQSYNLQKHTQYFVYIYMYSTHISLTFNSNIIQYIYIIYNSCYKIVLWSPHLCKFNNNTAGHNNLADLVQPSQEPLDTHPHCSCSGNRSHWSGTSAVMFFALQSWEVKQRK